MTLSRFARFYVAAALLSASFALAGSVDQTTSSPTDDALLARLLAQGGYILLEARTYTLSQPLNFRDRQQVVLEGRGLSTRLVSEFRRGQETFPIVDMVGSSDCRLANLRIRPTGDVRPACGILLGRSTEKSASNNYFDNVSVDGTFTVACVVNIGSELDVWNNPRFLNESPGGHNYVTAAWWPAEWRAKVSSPHGPIHGGEKWGGPDRAPDGVHTFLGGWFGVYGRSGSEINVWLLPGAHLVTFVGTYFSNKATDYSKPDTGGLAAVRVGAPQVRSGYYHDGLCFTNCYFETPGARYTFLVHDAASIQITGGMLLALENCFEDQAPGSVVTWSLNGVQTKGSHAKYPWRE